MRRNWQINHRKKRLMPKSPWTKKLLIFYMSNSYLFSLKLQVIQVRVIQNSIEKDNLTVFMINYCKTLNWYYKMSSQIIEEVMIYSINSRFNPLPLCRYLSPNLVYTCLIISFIRVFCSVENLLYDAGLEAQFWVGGKRQMARLKRWTVPSGQVSVWVFMYERCCCSVDFHIILKYIKITRKQK